MIEEMIDIDDDDDDDADGWEKRGGKRRYIYFPID